MGTPFEEADPTATHRAPSAARRWLTGWAVIALAITALTYLVRAAPAAMEVPLGPLDLTAESNLAVWFCSSTLLWCGLLLASAAVALRGRDPLAAAAVFLHAVVAFALATDEAGSLHERFDLLVPAALGLSLEGFGLIAAVPVLASIAVLFLRRRTTGPLWIRLLIVYGLFATVYAQEQVEHAIQWPDAWLPLRAIVEEGSELIAFFVLLRAAVDLRRRCREGDPDGAWPLLPTRGVLTAAFAAAAFLAPLLVVWMLSNPIQDLKLYHRGDFASVMMFAMFLFAGGACFVRARAGVEAGAHAWRWLGLGCLVLSLLQVWHLHTWAEAVLMQQDALRLGRGCQDLAWALPLFIALAALTRRHTGLRWWAAAALVLAWLACLVATTRDGFRLSYAASWLSALTVGTWIFLATRPPAAERTSGAK